MDASFVTVATLIDLAGELLLTTATLTLVVLIYRQVKLNQEHNRVLIKPIMAAEKYPHRSKLVLSFRNYGAGAALDVQARVSAMAQGSDAEKGISLGVIRPNENRNETVDIPGVDYDKPLKVDLYYTDMERKVSYHDEIAITHLEDRRPRRPQR